MKTKYIALIIVLLIGALCIKAHGQIKMENNILQFDETIEKGSVVWIETEQGRDVARATIRSKKEIKYAIEQGWDLSKLEMPKGIILAKGTYIVRFKYKGKFIKEVKWEYK